ncbi:pilus assembly PilX family protein [Halomonas mongoliensis]|uniref:pilus assembly PilX family protein n=1 Tax=Halomonas mongoliensis TaxID=321265 RepID=UPI00403B23AA
MKNQNGAALIVVLSLLTISLMVGLSSIQSSQIDERLAGNYRAQSEAQMGAETAAAAGWENVRNADWEDVSDLNGTDLESLRWVDFVGVGGDGGCEGNVECFYRYFEDGDEKYIVAIGAVAVVGAGVVSESSPLVVRVNRGGYFLGPQAAHQCYGSFCSYRIKGAAADFTGIDHLTPSNPGCNGGACNSGPSGVEENDRDKCYYPDVIGEYKDCRTEPLEGAMTKDDWLDYVSLISFTDRFFNGDTVPSLNDRSSPAFVEIVQGKVTRGTGNVNTVGVIVVREGATFDLSGTGHHEGVIIVEPGARIEYNGTPRVYGTIVTLEGAYSDDLEVPDVDISGNTAVRYSQAAIDLVNRASGASEGSSGWEIKGWF